MYFLVLLTMKKDLIACLLDLADSTTLFLESFKGAQLRISIDAQSEREEGDNCLITRATRLFFLSPDTPALFCTSCLDKHVLTHNEYCSLMETDTPIGKVFLNFNDARAIQKKNVTIALGSDRLTAARLNVKDSILYRKEYDYVVGKRKIGRIIEFFNEESIQR